MSRLLLHHHFGNTREKIHVSVKMVFNDGYITYLPSLGMGRSNKESGGGMEGAFPFYWLTRNTIINAKQNNLLNTRKQTELQEGSRPT